MSTSPCENCGRLIPLENDRCPHCGVACEFPNVKAAKRTTAELNQRYHAAFEEAACRGAAAPLAEFETATQTSKAVMARRVREAVRLVSSDRELVSTFYKLIQADACLPHNDKWDDLRRRADPILFSGYHDQIRFAALSLDGIGLTAYGPCSLVLSEPMVARRATVFEDNSAALMAESVHEPPGYRATWEERPKLCVAKHARDIHPETCPSEFPGLLLAQETSTEVCRFVEVQIWGSLSIGSTERIVLTPPETEEDQAFALGLEDLCAKRGIHLEKRE